MKRIIKLLNKISDWKDKYNQFSILNNMKQIRSEELIQQNLQSFQNYLQSIIQLHPKNCKKLWVSFQTRILLTYSNAISVIYDKKIQNFNQDQWQLIYEVFSYKNPYSIKYEVFKNILVNHQQRRRWSQRQQSLLSQIIKKCKRKNKWNNIARDLYITSQGQYYRQGKHCRDRYTKIKENYQLQINQFEQNSQKKLEFLKRLKNLDILNWKSIENQFSKEHNQEFLKKIFFKFLQIQNIQIINFTQVQLKLQNKIRQLQNRNQNKELIQINQIQRQNLPIQLINQSENNFIFRQDSCLRRLNDELERKNSFNLSNKSNITEYEAPIEHQIIHSNLQTNYFLQSQKVQQPLCNRYEPSYQDNQFYVPNFYMNWRSNFINQTFYNPFGFYNP